MVETARLKIEITKILFLRNTSLGKINPEIIIREKNSGMKRKYEINEDMAEYFANVPVGK